MVTNFMQDILSSNFLIDSFKWVTCLPSSPQFLPKLASPFSESN